MTATGSFRNLMRDPARRAEHERHVAEIDAANAAGQAANVRAFTNPAAGPSAAAMLEARNIATYGRFPFRGDMRHAATGR
jgi:hypothetical protein